MGPDSDFAPYASEHRNPGSNRDGNLYPFSNSNDCGTQGPIHVQCYPDELELDAVIIGASWAGIWALYCLQSLGLNVRLLNACIDVGGVWWYTRYPGCRVDTEIPFYEFSKPELWKTWNWSERFPSRAEIHSYLSWVCKELDLRKKIIFRTRVSGVQWDEQVSRWKVYSSDVLIATAQFILPCAGYSTIRQVPVIPGLDSFEETIQNI